MRAVNLLPSDLRRVGTGGGSGSGAGAYAVLAALAVAVLLAGVWAVTAREVKDREVEVVELNAEASAAEAQAAGLAGYEGTVKVAQTRRASVVGLIEKRFDWAKAFEDLSRTLPENAWITTMSATVAPGVAVEGGAGNPLRAGVNAPAIELTGCSSSQAEVARLMARLRAMKGVTRVGLATSEKSATSGSTGSSDSASSSKPAADCSQSSSQRPKFNLVIFYGEGTATAPAATAGSTPAAGTTPASGGTQ